MNPCRGVLWKILRGAARRGTRRAPRKSLPRGSPTLVSWPKTSFPVVKIGDLKGAGVRAKVRENIDKKYAQWCTEGGYATINIWKFNGQNRDEKSKYHWNLIILCFLATLNLVQTGENKKTIKISRIRVWNWSKNGPNFQKSSKTSKYSHFWPLRGLGPPKTAGLGLCYIREMLTFCVSFDAMEWLFMASWNFYDFWAFLGVKNGVFRRKLPFFSDFWDFIIVG